jgi:hypothetical protein
MMSVHNCSKFIWLVTKCYGVRRKFVKQGIYEATIYIKKRAT